MKLSNKGLVEIAKHEGIVPAPYFDSVGVLTFGVGHTAAAGAPNPADMERGMPADIDAAVDAALRVFRVDVARYEKRVNDAIDVPVEQHEFDALVSFDFNTGGIFRANLTRAINNGDDDAGRHFFGWLKPPEIRKRRTAEANLYDTGHYSSEDERIPVWNVDAAGKLRGIHSTVDAGDVLARMNMPLVPEKDADAVLRAIRDQINDYFGD